MFYLFDYSGHIRSYLESKFAQKLATTCTQMIILGNGQITHNFFDFQKFCAKLAFFAFIASIIQDDVF